MQQSVLVADDDESIRELLMTLLDEAGYAVVAAEDGAEAVAMAVEQPPDVAVLDVMMPRMNGFEACRAIKSDRRSADVPVILLTALAQTGSKVEGLDCGATDYVTKPFDAAELLARLRSALAEKTRRDALAAEALTDILTGLINRRGLEQQLDQLLAHSERVEEVLSLIMFDADRFKTVNDTYGHDIGDVVLTGLAQRAREVMRAQDVVGRFGGEEFMAILPSAGHDAALAAAERLRANVERTPITTATGAMSVTVSVGVATTLPGSDTERVALVAAADQALYTAKRLGRNRVVHAHGQPTAPLAPAEPPEAARALLEALALIHPTAADHARAISQLCWQIAVGLRLAPHERSRIALAGLLHDIGLLGGAEAGGVLRTGRGTATLQANARRAEEILHRLPSLHGIAPLVAAQYERWDGSGSPEGLHGEMIPLGSRILAVAEYYDAARQAGNADPSAAVATLRDASGRALDPKVVETALQVLS